MAKTVISTSEAARIYKKITGRRRTLKSIEADVHTFHHLGCFDYSHPSAEPKLVGVNRHAWEYFVTIRLLLRGVGQIFRDTGEDE